MLISLSSVPHYVVASRDLVTPDSGFVTLVTKGIDWTRRLLIEEVYYRLGELDAFARCPCCGVLMLSHSYHVP